MTTAPNPHAALKAEYRPGQRWIYRIPLGEWHDCKDQHGNWFEPYWVPANEYRRHPDESPAVEPPPFAEMQEAHHKWAGKPSTVTETAFQAGATWMLNFLRSREQAHTDHPLRHWDRTCPACNPTGDTGPMTATLQPSITMRDRLEAALEALEDDCTATAIAVLREALKQEPT